MKQLFVLLVLMNLSLYASDNQTEVTVADDVEILPSESFNQDGANRSTKVERDNSAFNENPFFVTVGPFDTGEVANAGPNAELNRAIQLMEPF